MSFFACEIFEKKKNFDRKDTLKSVFFWVHAPSRGVEKVVSSFAGCLTKGHRKDRETRKKSAFLAAR